jgi:hypothetical protein
MALLYLTSGDAYLGTRRLTVTVTDPAGVRVDLSGIDLTFMVKESKADTDVEAIITKTTPTDVEIAVPQSGATLGVAYIAIAEPDTYFLDGRYLWELEADDAEGPLTLARGAVWIRGDLVRGAS